MRLRKNKGEWTGKVEVSEEEIPGSRRGMHGYILTYSGRYRENLRAGSRILSPAVPHCGLLEKRNSKRATGLGRRTRQEISQMKPNDSPEIPDSGRQTSPASLRG